MKIFTRLFLIAFIMITRFAFAATTPPVQGNGNRISQATVEAYPNPSRGEITIRINQAGGENYKIRISNAIGSVVKTVDVPANQGESISVDLSNLPGGLYFYSLLANEKMVETKRLILQR